MDNEKARRVLIPLLLPIGAILLIGCSTAVEIVPEAEVALSVPTEELDIGATIQAGIEATQAALPTEMPTASPTIMPTEEPTSTPESTSTPEPEPTVTPLPEPTEAPEVSDEVPAAAAAVPNEESAEAPAILSGGMPACIWSNSLSPLSCINSAGEWVIFDELNTPTSHSVNGFALCSDGQLVIKILGDIYLLKDGDWDLLPQFSDDDLPREVYCGPNNEIWATVGNGLWRYDEAIWTFFGQDDVFPNIEDVGTGWSLVVNESDEIWAKNSVSAIAEIISYFDGNSWQPYVVSEVSSSGADFGNLLLDEGGTPYLIVREDIYRLENGAWTYYRGFDDLDSNRLTIDSNGELLTYGPLVDGIISYALDGDQTAALTVDNSELVTTNIDAVRRDDAARLWIGTRWGLNVWDGTNWQTYHVHDSPLPVNDISRIEIAGAGPPLPAPISKDPGSLSGSLFLDEAPLSGATIELCVLDIGMFGYRGATPCDGQPFMRTLITAEDGKFQFDELPPGEYFIFIQADDGGWIGLRGMFISSQEILVEPGEETKLGILSLISEDDS
ncbi:MAG: SpaA isopeptide-forming pilin-related protein [Chloroflexota bacterium]